MPNQSKSKSLTTSHISISLALLGAVLVIGWIIIAAGMNLAAELPCRFSPNACSEGGQTADAVLMTPLIMGSLILAFGVACLVRVSVAVKVLIGLALAAVFSWATWYLMIFAHILLHGL